MDGVCRRPRHNEKNLFTFRRKFTPGDLTSRKDVPFAMGVRGFETTIRNELCFRNSLVKTLLLKLIMQILRELGIFAVVHRTVDDEIGRASCRERV